MQPKVSVLIITYNHAKYIRQCLDSIISQKTKFSFEILIYDDASNDGTSEIIKEYQRKYPKLIKHVRPKINQRSKKNWGLNIKNLIPISKGNYIAFCDGDDYWTNKSKLQIAIDALEKNKDCIMFGHNTIFDDEINKEKKLIVDNTKIKNNRIYIENPTLVHSSSRVCRKIKGIPQASSTFTYHYYLSKGPCYYCDKTMSVYRHNGEGVFSALSVAKKKMISDIVFYYLNLFFKYKYNEIYAGLMPPEFSYFKDNFDMHSAWIFYSIYKGYRYLDLLEYRHHNIDIKIPNQEMSIWKLFGILQNIKYLRFRVLTNRKILLKIYKALKLINPKRFNNN